MFSHARHLLGPVFFTVVLLNFTALLHYYLFRGLARATPNRHARRIVGWTLAVLGTVMVAGPIGERLAPSPATLAAARLSYVWLGLAFYMFVALLAFDAIRLAPRLATALRRIRRSREERAAAAPPSAGAPDRAAAAAAAAAEEQAAAAADATTSRREFLARSATVAAFSVAVPTSLYGVWRAFSPPEVSEVSVPLRNLPRALSGLTIVQLSDIHVGPWLESRFITETVARVNALRPDLVAITGDLVDGHVDRLHDAVAPLTQLRSRFGTFFITGNHEYYSGADAWCTALRAMGLTVLRNRRTVVGDAGGSFDLVGVDDWSAQERGFGTGYDLDAALQGRDPERPAVLLAHQPRGFDEAVERGIGLQLSGHTHGGQIWPWTYVVRLAYPYSAGLYQHASGFIYVNRGCGFWGPPLRVGAPSEIARIALV